MSGSEIAAMAAYTNVSQGPAWKNIIDLGIRKVYCDCCERLRPAQGAQLFLGDICRCKTCTERGQELKHPGQAGKCIGRLGIDIELFKGQFIRTTERDEWGEKIRRQKGQAGKIKKGKKDVREVRA